MSLQGGQVVLDRVPYPNMIQQGVSMHENITEADDLASVGDLFCELRFYLGELGEGLADVLHLSLYR